MTYRAALSRITESVARAAADVDQHARFPRAALNSFGSSGILGMTISRGAGGGGQDLRSACRVVEEVARVCGSTATVLRSHFAAAAVLDRAGPAWLRAEIAGGRHLSTLAGFGTGAVTARGDVVDLLDRKNRVIGAGEADSYVWSAGTAWWLVPANAPGLLVPATDAGMGLRGTAAAAVLADPVRVPASNLLVSADGEGVRGAEAGVRVRVPAARMGLRGLAAAGPRVSAANARMGSGGVPATDPEEGLCGMAAGAAPQTPEDITAPWFLVLGAAVSLGLMEGALAAALGYLDHRTRADLARMRLRTDAVRVLHNDAVAAVTWRPESAPHRVQALAVEATEAAVLVTDLAMKVCGDAAFRRDLGIERRFRDARAAAAIEPTVDRVLASVELRT